MQTEGVVKVRVTAMSRIIAAVVLMSALAGCVTAEGPYSNSSISSLEPQRTAPSATKRPAKETQTARVWQGKKIQVSLHQRALGPLVHRAEYPIILGAAF
jgi:ABC-type uncharacterized transport system auxiliary subunit